jgi:hypothetical protein
MNPFSHSAKKDAASDQEAAFNSDPIFVPPQIAKSANLSSVDTSRECIPDSRRRSVSRGSAGPYFTIPKAALSVIRNKVESSKSASIIAVLASLRCAANDARQPEGPFQMPILEIALRSGTCYNTAAAAVKTLIALELLNAVPQNIPGTKERAPSIYSFPNKWDTSPKEPTLRIAESIKEQKEYKETCDSSAKPPVANAAKGNTSRNRHANRNRDPILDVLAALDGSDLSQVTQGAWGAAAKALKDIKEVTTDVTPEEIQRRADRYRMKFPNSALTPSALAKHWGALAAPAPRQETPLHYVNSP